MARLLIAGGGGFGLEIWDYLHTDLQAGLLAGSTLGGVLNDGTDCELLRRDPKVPHAGGIHDFEPRPNDRVIIAIGHTVHRRNVARLLCERGVELFTYVHPTARVSPTARLGEGVIIAPFSIVNAYAVIEDNVAVNVHCSVGHGSRIGAHSVLSPFCALSGDSQLGEACFLGTRATLFPKVTLGADCMVDAHSAVRLSAPERQLISVRGQTLIVPNRLTASR